MKIKINEIVNTTKISKISNGVNIFNKMMSEYKKDNTISSFELDFTGIESISVFAFKEIIRQMQGRLNGNFGLVIENGSPLVQQSFRMALKV